MVRKIFISIIMMAGLCFLFSLLGCNLTFFPDSLVYIEKRISLSSSIPENSWDFRIYILNDVCFLSYRTENQPDQLLYVINQDFELINPGSPKKGNFDTFAMYDLAGNYLVGNLVFDKDLKGPTDFNLFSISTDSEALLPPQSLGLTIGSTYQGTFWSNFYSSTGSDKIGGFITDAAWSDPGSFSGNQDLANWVPQPSSEIQVFYDEKNNVFYTADFVDGPDCHVDLYAIASPDFAAFDLNLVFNNPVAQYDHCDSDDFFMTDMGVIFAENDELVLYDFQGNKKAHFGFDRSNGDMGFAVDNIGEKAYIYDHKTRSLSKLAIGWKYE